MYLMLVSGYTSQTNYVDPTGTYDLSSRVRKKGGEIYGYFGTIQIKKLTKSRIILNFYVCKGAPSYNSGSFIDTLTYNNNKAIYTDPELDQSCKITFEVLKNGIKVTEETDDYNSGCGFGHAVIADGFYKIVSKKVPVLINPAY